jgi:DNA invertase Pin-like site-specific DNA recombinase
MGRLTLNVLLSFAQFERELASERVRDKIAASRRRGKWTGGGVPLGYRSENKKLVIDPAADETVRYIFRRYLDLGRIQLLADDLRDRGIRTKRPIGPKGGADGGLQFTYLSTTSTATCACPHDLAGPIAWGCWVPRPVPRLR